MKWLLEKFAEWFFAFFTKLREWGEALLASILDTVAQWIPDTAPIDAVSDTIAGINYFFPLSETVALLWAFLALWCFCKALGWVKGWIPFVGR